MLKWLLIGFFGVQFILERTNVANVKVVQNIQIRTRNLKSKKLIQYGVMIVVGGILWGLMMQSTLGDASQGLIVGMIWAIIMFMFESTIFDNARNTLR